MVENNKKNVVKLINAKMDTLRDLYRIYKDEENETRAQRTMDEFIAMHDVLCWLTDKKYFNDIWNIYNPAD